MVFRPRRYHHIGLRISQNHSIWHPRFWTLFRNMWDSDCSTVDLGFTFFTEDFRLETSEGACGVMFALPPFPMSPVSYIDFRIKPSNLVERTSPLRVCCLILRPRLSRALAVAFANHQTVNYSQIRHDMHRLTSAYPRRR